MWKTYLLLQKPVLILRFIMSTPSAIWQLQMQRQWVSTYLNWLRIIWGDIQKVHRISNTSKLNKWIFSNIIIAFELYIRVTVNVFDTHASFYNRLLMEAPCPIMLKYTMSASITVNSYVPLALHRNRVSEIVYSPPWQDWHAWGCPGI